MTATQESTNRQTIPYPSQAFIAGQFVDAASGATLDTYDPATGQVLASVADCAEEDVNAAVASARAAFDDGRWSRLAPAARKAALLRFADLVESELDEFARLESLNAGKPITDCRDEDLPVALDALRYYAELTDKVFGKIAPTGDDNLGLIVKEPAGVVGAVLPWNFPLVIVAQKIGPALAAGNSVVVKPPEQAPLTTLRLAQLAIEAGIPEGVFNVVPGRGEITGKAIGLHMDVDALTFTGSTAVGRAFLRYSADSNMKKVTLECGGKSPQIVLSDAGRDLATVAEQLAMAAFWNAGQNCTCGSRVLVHESLHDDLIAAFAEAAAKWKVGAPSDPSTRVGAIIEPSALDRIIGHIEEAKSDGAQVAYGGERLFADTGGWFVEPTILDRIEPQWRIAREEIFGPVTGVSTFTTDEEAVAMANATEYGLLAALYTHDLDRAHKISRALRAGTVAVNGFSEGDMTTPFGGYKASGFGGRDKGVEALDQYTEIKTMFFTLR